MTHIGPLFESPSSRVDFQGKPEDKCGDAKGQGMIHQPVDENAVEKAEMSQRIPTAEKPLATASSTPRLLQRAARRQELPAMAVSQNPAVA